MANQPIIVKKYKKGGHGHHGGAWKIAYADFVTAMMAFFLLMWLISISTEETKKGIVDYFTTSILQTKASSIGSSLTEGKSALIQAGKNEEEQEQESVEEQDYASSTQEKKDQQIKSKDQIRENFNASDIGDKKTENKIITNESKTSKFQVEIKDQQSKILEENLKKDSLPAQGVKNETKKEIDQGKQKEKDKDRVNDKDKEKEKEKEKDSELKDKKEKINLQQITEEEISQEKKTSKANLEKIIQNIKDALNSIKELEQFKHNLIIELTNEGIKIQIVDSEDKEMFASGSPKPVVFTEKIIQTLGGIIAKLPNKVNISGHTDSRAYKKINYSNWELSSDRAHATRRILEESGVDTEKFNEINGRADRDPFNKNNPQAPENRRISITILYDELKKQKQ